MPFSSNFSHYNWIGQVITKKIGVVIARGMPHHQVVKLEVVILVAKVRYF
jgi:hypothetical protein